MSISPLLSGIRILPADVASVTRSGVRPGEPSFGEQLRDAVSGVDAQGVEEQYKVANLMEGNGTDVHDAMIAVQKADLSFQLMVQVRNKVVQAYQEIERLQF